MRAAAETTPVSRDWGYIFPSLWRDSAEKKIRLLIADTVFMNQVGDPDVWYFTNKDGFLMKKNSENVKLNLIHDHFRQIALGYGKNTQKYVAMRRTFGGDATLETADDFKKAIQMGSSRFIGTVALQCFIHAKGGRGSLMRVEYSQSDGEHPRVNVFKIVNMANAGKTPSWATIKCVDRFILSNLHSITSTIVSHLESNKSVIVRQLVLEFIHDDHDRFWFSHAPEIITVDKPEMHRKVFTPTVPAGPILGRPKSRLARLDEAVDVALDAENEMLQEIVARSRPGVHKKRCFGDYCEYRLNEGDMNLRNSDALFKIVKKSVVLDRLDRAQQDDPTLPARLRVSLTGRLSLLKPSDYYQQVEVCERCYRMYTQKDAERETQVQQLLASKQTANTTGAARESSRVVSPMRGEKMTKRFLAQLDKILPDENPMKMSAIAQMEQELRSLGVPTDELRGIMKQKESAMMQSAKSSSRLKENRSRISEPSSRPSTAAGVLPREISEFLGEDSDQDELDDFPLRAQSALPFNTSSLQQSRASTAVSSLSLQHYQQQQQQPYSAMRPMTVGGDGRTSPMRLRDHLKKQTHFKPTPARHDLYSDDDPLAASTPMPQRGFSDNQADPFPAAPDGDPLAAEINDEAFVAANSQSRLCRIDKLTTVPWVLLTPGDEAGAHLPVLIIVHDFFETISTWRDLLQPLANERLCRVLLFNYPGQAWTEFSAQSPSTPAQIANVLEDVLKDALPAEEVRYVPLVVMGVGYGFMAASVFATTNSSYTTEALIGINAFGMFDERMQLVLQNWMYSSQHMTTEDFFAHVLSSFLFSKGFVGRVGVEQAVQSLQSQHNPISSEGRAFICKAGLIAGDMRMYIKQATHGMPVVLLTGSEDSFVSREHMLGIVDLCGEDAYTKIEECVAHAHGVVTMEIPAGHMLSVEAPQEVLRVIRDTMAAVVKHAE
eukprot:TRINITY_DN4985_c0_g1_i1.p1 TRINITY_DN4985_c0_g1~~TRINITY_DN4985_c0_g1_i1.p1  ORF type:complete len:946 (+),score=171.90 TRINITY_DN4985_c0_g1_i1:46-2883(+)